MDSKQSPPLEENYLSIEDMCSATSLRELKDLYMKNSGTSDEPDYNDLLNCWERYQKEWEGRVYPVQTPSVTWVTTPEGMYKVVGLLHQTYWQKFFPTPELQKEHYSQVCSRVMGDPTVLIEHHLSTNFYIPNGIDCPDQLLIKNDSTVYNFFEGALAGAILPLIIEGVLHVMKPPCKSHIFQLDSGKKSEPIMTLAQRSQLFYYAPPALNIPLVTCGNGEIVHEDIRRSAFLAQCARGLHDRDQTEYTTIVTGAAHVYEIAYFLRMGVRDETVLLLASEFINNPQSLNKQYLKRQYTQLYGPAVLGFGTGLFCLKELVQRFF